MMKEGTPLKRSKRPLTAVILTLVMLMAFSLPMASAPASAAVAVPAEGDILWADNLGGDGFPSFLSVTAAADGGFVAVGFMNLPTLENSDGSISLTKIGVGHNTLIVKYDASGNIEWADNMGGDAWDFFHSVTATADGGFVAVGSQTSSTLMNGDGSFNLVKIGTEQNAIAVKYDASGNIVWADNLGGDGYDSFESVTAAPDGGFAAAGYLNSTMLENSDGSFSLARIGYAENTLIVKYDASGNIEWADNLGGDVYDLFKGIAASPDGGFAAVGHMTSTTLENSDGSFSLQGAGIVGGNTLIVKYDASGNIEWGDSLGGLGGNYFYGVAAAPDGGFAAAGIMTSLILSNIDNTFNLVKIGYSENTLIVKYDASGNIEWGDNLGGDVYDYFYGVTTAPDGGFVAAGFMDSTALENSAGDIVLEKIGTGGNNPLIIKYDEAGSIVWADNLGGDGNDMFYCITTAADGGFAAVGIMDSSILENSDGSFSIEKIGTGNDVFIVRYSGAPPVFAVTVTGDHVVSWSPTSVTYGDENVTITFVTGSGHYVDRVVSVLMGTEQLIEGTDYVFEDGVLKILIPVVGCLSVEVTTASGSGMGTDLWWVLIASLSALSSLLLLAFVYKRRKEEE